MHSSSKSKYGYTSSLGTVDINTRHSNLYPFIPRGLRTLSLSSIVKSIGHTVITSRSSLILSLIVFLKQVDISLPVIMPSSVYTNPS